MKILLTGATGFIGYYLAQKLISDGHELIAIYRAENQGFRLCKALPGGIHLLPADLLDYESLDEICAQGIDLIVHAAALVSFDPRKSNQIRQVNQLGTAQLIDIALERKIPRFIYISSIAALGGDPELSYYDESTEWDENSDHSAYAQSKKNAELEVWRGMAEGLDITILQPAVVLGPWFDSHHSMQIITRMRAGLRWYPGGATAWLDIRDLADAVSTSIQKKGTNQKIILAGHNLGYQQLLDLVATYLGKDRPRYRLPDRLVIFGAQILGLAARLVGYPNEINGISMKPLFEKNQYLNDRSKQLLGLPYRPIESTIQYILANKIPD
jgi:dihydroflavonol-4-reductase